MSKKFVTIMGIVGAMSVIMLSYNNCNPLQPNEAINLAGTYSGGGGFGDESSMMILEIAQEDLTKSITNASPEIFSNLPQGWDKNKIIYVLNNVLIDKNNSAYRYNRELLFNYDSQANQIIATELYFKAHSSVPVNQMKIDELYPYIAEVKLKMLHELSHLMGVGLSEELDKNSREFAKRFLESIKTNFLSCETSEASFHDSYRYLKRVGIHGTGNDIPSNNNSTNQEKPYLTSALTAQELWIHHPMYEAFYNNIGVLDPLAEIKDYVTDTSIPKIPPPNIEMKFIVHRPSGFTSTIKGFYNFSDVPKFDEWEFTNPQEAYDFFKDKGLPAPAEWTNTINDEIENILNRTSVYDFSIFALMSNVPIYNNRELCAENSLNISEFCRSRLALYPDLSYQQLYLPNSTDSRLSYTFNLIEYNYSSDYKAVNNPNYDPAAYLYPQFPPECFMEPKPVPLPDYCDIPEIEPAPLIPGVEFKFEFAIKSTDKIEFDLTGPELVGTYSIDQTYTLKKVVYENDRYPERNKDLDLNEPVTLTHSANLVCEDHYKVIEMP